MSDQMDDASPPRSDHREPRPRQSWFAQCKQRLRATNPLRVIGGALLAVLIFAAAVTSVMFFAAAQLQSRIAELNLNGAPLTIWRVDAFREEFDKRTREIGELRAKIESEQRTLAKDQRQYQGELATQESEALRVAADARTLHLKISSAATVRTTTDSALLDTGSTIAAIEILASNGELNARFGEELGSVKRRYAKNEEHGASVRQREADLAGYKSWIASLIDERKESVEGAARLFGDTNTVIAPEIFERIINVTAEVRALGKTWNGIIYYVALWTNDMLVLSLLISMGVLGAALNLLATFFAYDEDSLSFGEYPLRLAFGAVLAIVMFIIAKAGVPILADTTKIGGNAPLNPYFISLLAVVSGLMSDRAMATVRNFATTLFQSVGGADYSQRYTRVSLEASLQAANRDETRLAELLKISVDDLKQLFSGNAAVSPDRQVLIAAYLGQKPRELFSDIPAG